MSTDSWTYRRRWGFAVGLAMTAVGCGAWALGLLDPVSRFGLDLHFRHLGTIDADPRIVLIDINDHALSEVHGWPWPRRLHAQLVETLAELNAQAIVLDIGFFERTEPRATGAGLGLYYDVEPELVVLGSRSVDAFIYDDDELRDAIGRAGNVYLAMFFRLSPPNLDPIAKVEQALDLLRQRPEITYEEFRAALALLPPPWTAKDLFDQARLATLLEEDFRLDAAGLGRLRDPRPPAVGSAFEKPLVAAKQLVARQKADRFLSERPEFIASPPDEAWVAFFAWALPGEPFNALSPDRSDLRSAILAERARHAIVQRSPFVSPALRTRIPHAYDLTVPLDKLVESARGVGFVALERSGADGVVRELPPVVDADGSLFVQLGLLVAMDALGFDRSAISYEDGWLVVGTGADARRLPLDENGHTLLNWHAPGRGDRWQDSFVHIPVTRVIEIALNRSAIEDNRRRLGIALAELVEVRHRDTQAEYARYVRLVNQRLGLSSRGRRGDYRDEVSGGARPTARANTPQSEDRDALDRAIREIEEEAIVWLGRAWRLREGEEPQTDEERAEREKIRELYEKFGKGQRAAAFDRLNSGLAKRNRHLIKELRPKIEGKICLVGYTASAVADFVPTPVFTRAPGVMVHANVINMMFLNQSAVRAPGWVSGLVILFGGLAITMVTRARGPLLSLAALAVLVGAVLAGGGLLFRVNTYHFASIVASLLICVVWASVTVYRQFTEQRVRRRFQRALSQYTSPAMAARIAAAASITDFAPRPVQVTCFFSDLQGFTPLSERLGAARTRVVLNAYLATMSRVLMEHDALVNKFMGDGIFAFFNAPLLPCADHVGAACASAVASQRALGELNARLAVEQHFEPLIMRIGLATGETFVGDYGADRKLDYTCIGDTVNLGSRLEQANKALGTAVLVDDPTRREAGDGFVFRRIGRIIVAGKAAPVEAYELAGSSDAVDGPTLSFINNFDQAVQRYQGCQWDKCAALLRECHKLRPNDRAVVLYEDALARHRPGPVSNRLETGSTGPPADWSGAIDLTTHK